LAVMLALFDVLTVRFERGIVTGHSVILLLAGLRKHEAPAPPPKTRTTFELYNIIKRV
jgi:hypothetical protein